MRSWSERAEKIREKIKKKVEKWKILRLKLKLDAEGEWDKMEEKENKIDEIKGTVYWIFSIKIIKNFRTFLRQKKLIFFFTIL